MRLGVTLRNKKSSSNDASGLKRQHWNKFGMEYNYDDSYSLILKTWSQQLRDSSNDLIDEVKKLKSRRKTTRGGTGGFVISKFSTRIKGRLKVGDRVSVSQILFNKHRDFLITYKDRNRPVQAKHLEGKVVILYFVPLTPWDNILLRWVTSLVDIYDVIQSQGVEVVFIGVNTRESPEPSLEECFDEKFSICHSVLRYFEISEIYGKKVKIDVLQVCHMESNRLGCY